MHDLRKVLKAWECCKNPFDRICEKCPFEKECCHDGIPDFVVAKAVDLLKEREAVKPRVSSVEQRCGNCNKVIEMDGWKACPWCGKPILWEAVGRSVK